MDAHALPWPKVPLLSSASTNFVTPYDELLHLVNHLLSKGAIALEVTHGGSTVKANLERPVIAQDLDLVAEKEAAKEFEAALYYSTGSEA